MPVDSIVLASDLNPNYIEFWPLVARAWHRLLGVQVHLALVGEPTNLHLDSFPFGRIHFLKPVPDIPIANQAKVARYYVAGMLPDTHVVSTNDIDLLPLQMAHIERLCGMREPGRLVVVGSEFYTGPEAGKCMAGYVTGEAELFNKLFKIRNKNWNEFVLSFVGHRVCDHKEDISSKIPNDNPECFSDESLLRALLLQANLNVQRRAAYHYPDKMLCRSNWLINADLRDFADAHLPRPYHAHRELIHPLAQYLGLT